MLSGPVKDTSDGEGAEENEKYLSPSVSRTRIELAGRETYPGNDCKPVIHPKALDYKSSAVTS